jgi:tetratricopeptide (TPR) repeat protein
MDPNFAPGWATLAVAAAFGEGGPTHASRAEEYARHAISLAPNLAAGHAALGFALGNRGPVAQASLRKAVALDPNDIEALNWLAGTLEGDEYTDDRFKLYSRIVEIEPLWWPAVLNKLGILLAKEDFAAAEKERQRLDQLGSVLMAGIVGMTIENAKGDISEAARIGINTFNAVGPKKGGILGVELVFILLKLGYLDEAQANFSFVPPPAPYLWRNDPRGLDMIEALHLPPRTFFASSPLTDSASRVYLLSGRGARLAELYRSAAFSPAGFKEAVGEAESVNLAPTIALALRQSGDDAEASALVAAAESTLDDLLRRGGRTNPMMQGYQADYARIYAMQGRKADALNQLTAAVQSGWIPNPPLSPIDIAMDPPMALLKGDARFEKARQAILDHIKRERAELGPIRLSGQKAAAAAAAN